jgi:uncharacterized protein (DUF433 family)
MTHVSALQIAISTPLVAALPTRREASLLRDLFSPKTVSVFGGNHSQANIVFLQRKLNSSSEAVRSAVAIDPGIVHGNPVVKGTRIPLYVLVEELAEGSSIPEIIEGYPSLDESKIRASLDYVAHLLRVYGD